MQTAGPGHEQWEDATGAYLLGAMEEVELTAFEEHLAGCPACREDVDYLLPAVRALPVSVEPIDPPMALKSRIMAEVEREASLLAAAGPEADRPPGGRAQGPTRRRLRLPSLRIPRLVPAAVAGVLLLVGVAIGVGATQLDSDPERTIKADVTQTTSERRANAELEINGGEARLVARGLPAPPTDRVYQVWLKRDGHAPEPTPALFKPSRDGTATASVPGSLDGVDQVMVTDEPDGGSPQPTGDLLLVADLS